MNNASNGGLQDICEPCTTRPSRITILQAVGKRLCKSYRRDHHGNIVKIGYDRAAEFRTAVYTFVGLDGLADLLRWLHRQPDRCVIRAAPGPWHPGPQHAVLRRHRPQVEYADDHGRFHKTEAGRRWPVTVLPMFEEQPTDWLLLDVDRARLPAGLDWRSDLAYTAAYARRLLPAAFHDARCVWYATGSAADLTKPDLGGDEIKLRLGFVLERGVVHDEAKR